MNEITRIDQVLALLRRKQARGGMSYRKAVHTETLITALERMQVAVIAVDVVATGPISPKLSDTALDAFLKGVTELARWMILAEMATEAERDEGFDGLRRRTMIDP